VVAGPEDDGYDMYLMPTLKLLESEASAFKTVKYLEHFVGVHM
jgi:hypothetical protein